MTDLRSAIEQLSASNALLAASNMEVLPKELAAKYCKLSEETLEAAVREGKIHCSRQYSRLFFQKTELEAFMLGEGGKAAQPELPQAKKTSPRKNYAVPAINGRFRYGT